MKFGHILCHRQFCLLKGYDFLWPRDCHTAFQWTGSSLADLLPIPWQGIIWNIQYEFIPKTSNSSIQWNVFMQEHTFEVIVSNVASISKRPQLRIYFNEPVWTGVSLVQVMVCRFMFGAKPLPEPIPSYSELNPSKIKFKCQHFLRRKMCSKYQPF